jgi:hypothetical protein
MQAVSNERTRPGRQAALQLPDLVVVGAAEAIEQFAVTPVPEALRIERTTDETPGRPGLLLEDAPDGCRQMREVAGI